MTAHHHLEHAVSASLSRIAEACSRVLRENEDKLVITTSVAFGSCWLLPRLLEFQKAHPEIAIRLMETDECLDLTAQGVDFAIRYGKGTWARQSCTKLFNEEFFPVCSRDYAEAAGIASIESLQDATLLHLAGAAHRWEDWTTWFALAGSSVDMPRRGLWFQNYDNLLKAAVAGQGVALGWTRLVADAIEDGSLICPLKDRFSTGNGYYLIENRDLRAAEAREMFRRWILSFGE